MLIVTIMLYVDMFMFGNRGLLVGGYTWMCNLSSALYQVRHFTQNWHNLLFVNV